METSFCELKGKEVINIVDGKKLGRIIDLVFETSCGRVLGIVVPAYNKSWNIFKSSEDIFIPYNCICKFGDDAILVRIFVANPKQISKRGRFVKTASMPENTNQVKASGQKEHKEENLDQNYASQNNFDSSIPLYPSNDSDNYQMNGESQNISQTDF